MNENNVDYLKNQVKYTGFGDSLEFKLKDGMQSGAAEFQLSHKPDFGNEKAEATLHFRKSDQGNYFFNKYDLAIEKENAEPLKQTFYVGKDNTFTLKEAFNLLEGRSVNKDLVNKEKESYNTWVKLDFSEADNRGNFKMKHFSSFDLEAAMSKLPIKALDNEGDKKQLMDSLQKGNRQMVTMRHNGNEEMRGIEANPQFKNILVFDGNRRVKQQSEKQETSVVEGQSEKAIKSSRKAADKGDPAGDDDGSPKQQEKKQRKRAQRVS